VATGGASDAFLGTQGDVSVQTGICFLIFESNY